MTSVAPAVALAGAELLDEQAASPAARRPVAASASARLLNLGVVVNGDCPLGLNGLTLTVLSGDIREGVFFTSG
jgi:hypothetical protein